MRVAQILRLRCCVSHYRDFRLLEADIHRFKLIALQYPTAQSY